MKYKFVMRNKRILSIIFGILFLQVGFLSIFYSQSVSSNDPLPILKQTTFDVNKISQNYSIPVICITNVTFPEVDMEEGKDINITIAINSEVPMSLTDLKLVVMLSELTEARGKEPEVCTFNKTVELIPASSMINASLTITSRSGQFMFTSFLLYNEQVIPDSSFSTQILVMEPPIGKIQSLVVALVIIGGFFMFIPVLPRIFETIKYRSNKGEFHE